MKAVREFFSHPIIRTALVLGVCTSPIILLNM